MNGKPEQIPFGRIAFIGSYVPRQCGIATFTADLCEAVAAERPETTCCAIPINDSETGYPYPPRVRFEIPERDLDAYRRAADYLNLNNVDLVCVQHEFGIYGGRAGSHLLTLLRGLRMTVVTTLHTVLREPDADQRLAMEEIIALSDRLVVMTDRSASSMREIYGAPMDKIDIIPHGIPDVPFVDTHFHKDRFGVEGQTVILTFGLLSPNKGIEHMIAALPAVLERHPNVVYIVLGATHPHLRKSEGETYRLSLHRLAQDRGVQGQVIFLNRYVSLEELIECIGAADIFVTPYLNAAQAVSGTLAYTLGAGKAVVSTPYWHAEELLQDERGVLVPFRDPEALARGINELLDDEPRRNAMRKRAYLHGRGMIWSESAKSYLAAFERARAGRSRAARRAFAALALNKRPLELPPLNLDHLHRLTDDTGILQHAIYTIPNLSEGYTTDDNARALIVAYLLSELGLRSADAARLAPRYLAFLLHAFNPTNNRFRNFLSYDRRWLEEAGSDDSNGRSLWALGAVLAGSDTTLLRITAAKLFERALPAILETTSPRAWAFALIGIHEYLRRFAGDRGASDARQELASRLMRLYEASRGQDWLWFEETLAYCNAALPHALLLCGQWISNGAMRDAALEALGWLCDTQRAGTDRLVPIGSNGFYPRGGERARFDQQPVEAQATVSACLEAYRLTGEERWRDEARRAFEWFLGRNDLGVSVYDPSTGGTRDGLHPDRVNENEGAESTLAFLQALLELRLAQNAFAKGV